MQYEIFRQKVLNGMPRREIVPLSKIKIESINELVLDGKVNMLLSERGFMSLINYLEITKKTLRTFKNSLGKRKTEQFVTVLCQALADKAHIRDIEIKEADGSKTTKRVVHKVVMLINAVTGKIDQFIGMYEFNKMQPERYFLLVERAIRAHNLDICDKAYNEVGDIVVNTYSRDHEFINPIDKKKYFMGLQYDYTMSKFTVRPLVYCEETGQRISFSNTRDTHSTTSGVKQMQDMFEDILVRHFIAHTTKSEFIADLSAITNMQASLNEQYQAYRKVLDSCPIKDNRHVNKLIGDFIKFPEVRSRFAEMNFNVMKETQKSRKKIRSNQTIYQIVKGLSLLCGALPGADHSYDVVKLSHLAGRYMTKDSYDLSSSLPKLLEDPDVMLPRVWEIEDDLEKSLR